MSAFGGSGSRSTALRAGLISSDSTAPLCGAQKGAGAYAPGMRTKVVVPALLGLVVAIAGVTLGLGAWRWRAGTAALRARIESGRVASAPRVPADAELASLPPAVERYLRAVLPAGRPIIAAASFVQRGEMNMADAEGNAAASWKPFTSTQRVVVRRPGFDWDARIQVAPGMQAFVHDAYALGEGALEARLFGLFRLADQRGTPEAAQGELLRFLAETAWYPTALVPGQGVRWQALDPTSARATLVDGATTATLDVRFGADGLIDTVTAAARSRTVGQGSVATPWQGRFWNYSERHGVLVPLEGEVAWLLPSGPWPYWRGRLETVDYEFAP